MTWKAEKIQGVAVVQWVGKVAPDQKAGSSCSLKNKNTTLWPCLEQDTGPHIHQLTVLRHQYVSVHEWLLISFTDDKQGSRCHSV